MFSFVIYGSKFLVRRIISDGSFQIVYNEICNDLEKGELKHHKTAF